MSNGLRIDPRELPIRMQVQLAMIFVKEQQEKEKKEHDKVRSTGVCQVPV